jgi:uncharacterized protein YbjT (DUF2867 family)
MTPAMTAPPASDRLTLLTGVSGYVGGKLLRDVQQRSYPVRCLARSPESLRDLVEPGTELMRGDLLERASLDDAFAGVHTACYLVHSMAAGSGFEQRDRHAATNFADAARRAGISQIVYLGGLGHESDLSAHLASRQEVGRLLRASGVPTVELRASIVIGPGSASFETLRALVEHVPVILAPRTLQTLAQPIAIADMLRYLRAAIELESPLDGVFEVGGRDRVSYAQLMREYARARGLRRPVLITPLLTPRLSRRLVSALAPAHGRIAAEMVESLRNETTAEGDTAATYFGVSTRGVSAAIERALLDDDDDFAERRWAEAIPRHRVMRWGGLAVGGRRVSSNVVQVDREPDDAFIAIQRLGGQTGWYATDWFWRLRGCLDRARGGVGLRRGRRDPVDLRVGDQVDFWRVERIEPGRLLRLAAEMKMPGRLWLQFEVRREDGQSTVRQTTVFDPSGLAGLTYWYALYPIHRRVFGQLLQAIESRASIPARGACAPLARPLAARRKRHTVIDAR